MQNDPFWVERRAKISVIPSISFFWSTPPLKKKSHFLEKVVLLARRSAAERNRIARSFGGERNKIARRFMRKGTRLLVVLGGREPDCSWNINEINLWDTYNLIWYEAKDAKILFLSLWIYEQSCSLPPKTTNNLVPFRLNLRAILFLSPPKLRAILFLSAADLQARSTTFSISINFKAFFL